MLNLSGRDGLSIQDAPYRRADYIRHGALLMAVKYAVDLLVIWFWTGILWTPVDYVLSLATLQGSKATAFPTILSGWLLAWSLPFICVGVLLSYRRARDAGLPAWIVVGFFVPLVNYALMMLLAAWPSQPAEVDSAPEPAQSFDEGVRRRARLAGVLAGLLVGLFCVGLGTLLIGSYGIVLFLATPFLIGMATAFVARAVDPLCGNVEPVIFASLAVIAGALLLVAIEGIVCMIMAAPLAIPLALMGGMVGKSASRRPLSGSGGMALLIVLLPAGQAIDGAVGQSPTREVYSAIVIGAPPAVVWKHVVSFEDIPTPPAWYFRAGLAYPVHARIEGSGVGAVRWCEFTTGAFREPITAWEAPARLAFDVTDQPPPLAEWSPYRNIYAPHVNGIFQTTRGEFRLVALPDGRTRLEGRTWYSLRMQPQTYWTMISDVIIHGIHERVLKHIKSEAESAALSGTPQR